MNEIHIHAPFIIYGLGKMGKIYYNFFKDMGLDSNISCFCDRRYLEIVEYDGKKCCGYDEAKKKGIPFFLSVYDHGAFAEIAERMDRDGIQYYSMDNIAEYLKIDKVEFNRAYISYFHQDNMDNYYCRAEENVNIDVFWKESSVFFQMFEKLDLNNVIELACGKGRHVKQYIDKAGTVTLVDVLDKNIRYCQSRFENFVNVHYYCNNGYNLERLQSEQYTALFSYDAMVHFEMMDIYEYLKDIYRVLIKGGRVLIHHSNYNQNYKASFVNSPHGRSYMADNLFAYLAFRCGFKILEQKTIPWGGIESLDCISLLEK